MSRLSEIIDTGDIPTLIKVALDAAFSDERCECESPDIVGRDLMCGNCLKNVRAQEDALYQLRTNPHPYEERADLSDIEMCGLCSRWKDDPIHAVEKEDV